MPYKDPVKRRENFQKWKENHRENYADYFLYRAQKNEKYRKWRSGYWKEKLRDLKFTVMAIYSDGQPQCTCCFETRIEFLTIDHIDGHGADHRKRIRRNGAGFYRWIIEEGFPEELQVLCFNCNCAKAFFGICPHKEEHN